MVVPIRELANTLFSTSATSSQPFTMANLPSNMDMDVDIDIIRGRSASSNRNSSRESSILSNALSSSYHERMEMQNNLLDENVQNPIDSPQLSYMLNVEKVGNLVSKTTDNSSQNRTQCV